MGASLKVAWNAGELSPLLDGRSDLAKYHQGCTILENFIPTIHGPIYRRPGTRYVEDCSGIAPVLVPFVFNRTQSYVLAFRGSRGIAVYSNRGRVLTDEGSPYSFGYSIWDTIPRRADGTMRISYTQSGDTLFVCDAEGGLPLMAIVRKGHNDWTIAPYELANPPADEWNHGTCVLYKQLADGTTAPDGEYYLAVGIGESKFTISAAGYGSFSFNVAAKLESSDQSSNIFASDVRGKILVDLGAGVSSDDSTGVTWSGGSYTWAESAGMVSAYLANAPYKEGKIVKHLGRFYRTRSDFVSKTEPLHEGDTSRDATDFEYIGNGTVCMEILESGISDTFVNTDATTVPIFCARVKCAAAPGNEMRADGMLFERPDPLWVSTTGVTGRRASSYYKFMRWAKAGLRDFTEVPGAENIGSLPDNVTIFRERLTLSVNRTLHVSVAGDFPNFSALDGAGQVVADCALNLDLLAGDLSPVSWIAPAEKLVLGSFGGERAIGEQNLANAFGPTNVKVDVSTSNGSRYVPPAVIGSDILYVDRSGRRIRRSGMALDPADAADLSILSEHIGARSPFVDSAWQQSPSSVLWFAQADGGLSGLTYDRSQDVIAWHRHNVGGKVRALCSIPSPDGTRDDLWLVVERVIGGSTKFYLEVMPDDFSLGRPVSDQDFLDCSLEYQAPEGTSATTLSGLSHLNGAEVAILGDGMVLPSQTVSSGSVSFQTPSSHVFVGINNPSRARTMRLEKSPDGVSLGKISRIHRVILQLIDTVGLKVGPTFLTSGPRKMERKEFRTSLMPMDTAVPIQTLDIPIDFTAGYDATGYVCIEQDQPLPCTILSAAIEFTVQS